MQNFAEGKVRTGDRFVSYKLDDKTVELGHRFTDSNIKVIQNYISAHAHDHLNLTYTDAEPTRVAIQQAYIKGAIDALEHLLISHYAVQDGEKED